MRGDGCEEWTGGGRRRFRTIKPGGRRRDHAGRTALLDKGPTVHRAVIGASSDTFNCRVLEANTDVNGFNEEAHVTGADEKGTTFTGAAISIGVLLRGGCDPALSPSFDLSRSGRRTCHALHEEGNSKFNYWTPDVNAGSRARSFLFCVCGGVVVMRRLTAAIKTLRVAREEKEENDTKKVWTTTKTRTKTE